LILDRGLGLAIRREADVDDCSHCGAASDWLKDAVAGAPRQVGAARALLRAWPDNA
jgi:hypothetical protein